MKRLLVVAFVLNAIPARAQRFELAPFTIAAVTTPAPLNEATPGLPALEVAGGFTYGAQAAYLLSPHMSIEALWTRQKTSITIGTPSTITTLHSVDLTQLVGNVAYEFRSSSHHVQPFVFAGAGASSLSSSDINSQAKFTWDIGAGLKWFPVRHLGARFDGRYQSIQLGTSTDDYCSPFPSCQSAVRPVQFSSAFVLRF